MANIARADYYVEGLPIELGELIERPPLLDKEGLGCAAIIFVGFFLLSTFFVSMIFEHDATSGCVVSILVNVFALAITFFLLTVKRDERYENLKATDLATRKAAAKKEASDLTSKAAELLERSRHNTPKLPKYLADASAWLNQAQHEYNDKAYGPFWDAMEQSAVNLAAFRETVQQLTQDSASYYQMLSGRTHTFPAFAITSRTLPDPTAALNQLQSTLRTGQTSFEFATIWEQRRTREVLIAGFRNLGDAMSNLRFAIQGSVDELQGSLSSKLAQLLEEQVLTREASAAQAVESSAKLDEIHKKIPGS